MTSVTKTKPTRDPKYYHPSPVLVEALDKELQYHKNLSPQSDREENTQSKRKHDAIDRIFQSLLDVVYFLEFIEDHRELHEVYENDLKDLLGISEDPSPRPYHVNNRGGALFSRLIIASIFGRWGYTDRVQHYDVNDFRLHLIDNMIDIAVQAMAFRLGSNLKELKLFTNSIENTTIWSDLLAARYKPRKERISHRRIGYCVSVSDRQRLEYEAEQIRKGLS